MLYAGTAPIDTTVSTLLTQKVTEKSVVEGANPQETDNLVSGSSETLRKASSSFNFVTFAQLIGRRGGALSRALE